MAPHIFITRDGGKSFARIAGPTTAGIRGYAHVIKEDRVDAKILYAGTEFGMFISRNGGANWEEFRPGNFPAVAVRDIVQSKKGDDLVLATHGRGIWVIDDVSPLRSLTPAGNTNMWDGLVTGLDLVRTAMESGLQAARCATLDILTDGQPNVDPPSSKIDQYGRRSPCFVTSLRDYKDRLGGNCPAMVNTLGFGDNIQREMLEALACEGGGHFSFIPSPDMVATNFVNAAAAFGSAYTLTPTLRYGVGQGGAHGEGGSLVPGVSLGLLPYGARVSVLVDTPPGAPPAAAPRAWMSPVSSGPWWLWACPSLPLRAAPCRAVSPSYNSDIHRQTETG
jgi:hypothetical protein